MIQISEWGWLRKRWFNTKFTHQILVLHIRVKKWLKWTYILGSNDWYNTFSVTFRFKPRYLVQTWNWILWYNQALVVSAMFAKQVTWLLSLLYIFITREFWYLGLRKAATPKYLDQVNLTLKTFQWPWFRSYNTFGSKLVWSEYLVHLNHILTPTFEHFDTIRPRWHHQCGSISINVHTVNMYRCTNFHACNIKCKICRLNDWTIKAATKHVWATSFQLLNTLVATKALNTVILL